jgi:hypothetical protein
VIISSVLAVSVRFVDERRVWRVAVTSELLLVNIEVTVIRAFIGCVLVPLTRCRRCCTVARCTQGL